MRLLKLFSVCMVEFKVELLVVWKVVGGEVEVMEGVREYIERKREEVKSVGKKKKGFLGVGDVVMGGEDDEEEEEDSE